MRAAWQTILVLIVICCIATGSFFVWRFMQVDRCLDSGGHWLYDKKLCQTGQGLNDAHPK